MAIKKVEIYDPTNDYVDKIYPETGVDMVDMGDGSNLQDKLNGTDVKIGNLASLSTTNKNSLVSAVNEVDGIASSAKTKADNNAIDIGAKASLTTSAKGNLVNAINEVHKADKYYDTTGTATALVVTTGYFQAGDNEAIKVIPNISNTGAVTLNVDGKGAKSIKKFDADSDAFIDLEEGDIVKNTPIQLTWDSTNDFFVFAPKGGAGANYEKLGYGEPPSFNLFKSDTSNPLYKQFPNLYPRNTGVLISKDKKHIYVSYQRMNNSSYVGIENGYIDFNIEDNTVIKRNLDSSKNTQLMSIIGQSTDERLFMFKIASPSMLEIRTASNGSLIWQGGITPNDINNMIVINNTIYFFASNTAKIHCITSTGSYKIIDKQMPSGGGGGYLTEFQGNLLWMSKTKNQPSVLININTKQEIWRKSRTHTTNDSVQSITTGGNYIYYVNYDRKLVKRDKDLKLIAIGDVTKDAIGYINLSYSKMIYNNGKIYISMYFSRDYVYTSEILCFDAKSLKFLYKVDNLGGMGIMSSNGECFQFDVNNGIIFTMPIHQGHDEVHTERSNVMSTNNPLKIYEENIIARKDIIKNLK